MILSVLLTCTISFNFEIISGREINIVYDNGIEIYRQFNDINSREISFPCDIPPARIHKFVLAGGYCSGVAWDAETGYPVGSKISELVDSPEIYYTNSAECISGVSSPIWEGEIVEDGTCSWSRVIGYNPLINSLPSFQKYVTDSYIKAIPGKAIY